MTERSHVEVGVIVGAHALRGEVRVKYFGDGPDTLLDAETIWLGEPGRDALAAFTVERAGTGRAGEVRLGLTGIGDRDAAAALRGRLVLIAIEELPALGADDFYWHELIGCRVITQGGREIGVVRELWDTGRHDVLVVEAGQDRPVLIPTAREIMTRVDLEQREIVVDAIPGLIEGEDDASGGDR